MVRVLWKRWVCAVVAGAAVAAGSAVLAQPGKTAPAPADDTILLKNPGGPDRKLKVVKTTPQKDGSVIIEAKDVASGDIIVLTEPAPEKGGADMGAKKDPLKDPFGPRSKKDDPAGAPADPPRDRRLFGTSKPSMPAPPSGPSGTGPTASPSDPPPAEGGRRPGLLGRIFGRKPSPGPSTAGSSMPAPAPSPAPKLNGGSAATPPLVPQPGPASTPPLFPGNPGPGLGAEPPRLMPSKPLVQPPAPRTDPTPPAAPPMPVVPATPPLIPSTPAPPPVSSAPPVARPAPSIPSPMPSAPPAGVPAPMPIPTPGVPAPPPATPLPGIPALPGSGSGVNPASAAFRAGPSVAMSPGEMAAARELQPHARALTGALLPSARMTAALALSQCRHASSDYVKGLLFQSAQADPCPAVRAACIDHLCKLGFFHPDFMNFLKVACTDPAEDVRSSAKMALGKMTPRQW